jgi:ADP-heptose:LPS heptosyltransferase
VERWCRLLAHHGIRCDVGDLRLTRPSPLEERHVGSVVVHPGAASTGRRWPPDRFAAVIRVLRTHGVDVVLTGSSAEADLCSQIRDLAGEVRITSLAGSTDLEGLCCLIASARAVVSNDTGVAHLATAFGVASVTLFGPTSPERWGPPTAPIHRCLWAGREGDPHADELDPGLAAITVDEVTAAVVEVLRAAESTCPEVG